MANPLSAEARALAALDAAGIRWAALRDDPLAEGQADIDVLVHPDDASRLGRALGRAGFARLRTWRHGEHRFFIAYDEARDAWIKVDTVTRFAYRSGRELPGGAVDAALTRASPEGGASRLHPDDEFWTLLLHCLLDRGEVPERHLDRLRRLAEHDPGGPIRDALAEPMASMAAVERARARDSAGLVDLREELQSRLRPTPVLRRLWRRALWVASPILKAALRPGISVALLGPDGSGKSTLVRALRGAFPIPVKAYYLGLYGERARRARSFGFAGQLALAWGTYVAAGLQRRRGHLIVFDRYGYDALLPSADGGWKRAVRGALLGRLAPRPDLVVVLDAPPASLRRRKAEHDLETIRQRRDGYRRLARGLAAGGNTELVDASIDPSRVRRRVKHLVWHTYSRRRGGVPGDPEPRRYDPDPGSVEEAAAHGDR